MRFKIQALIGTAQGFAYLVVEAAGALAFAGLSVRQYGAVEAGAATSALYLVALFNVLVVCFGTILARAIAQSDPEHQRSFINESLVPSAYLVVAAAIVLVLVLVAQLRLNLGSDAVHSLLLLAGCLAVGYLCRSLGLLSAFRSVGMGRLAADKRFQLKFSLLCSTCMIAAVWFGVRPVTALAVAYVLCGAFLAWQHASRTQLSPVFNGLGAKRGGLSSRMQRVMKDSTQYTVTGAAGYVVVNGDALILSTVLGPQQMVSFLVISKLTLGVFSVAGVLGSVVLPSMSAAYASGNDSRYGRLALWTILNGIGLTCLCVFICYLVYPHLHEWVTVSASQPPRVFAVAMLNAVLLGVIASIGWPLLATGRTNLTVPTLVDAGLLVCIGAVAVSIWGFMGVLLAASVAHAVSLMMQLRLAWKTWQRLAWRNK
jgi:O-antigen/teichoic acid export membrane protein